MTAGCAGRTLQGWRERDLLFPIPIGFLSASCSNINTRYLSSRPHQQFFPRAVAKSRLRLFFFFALVANPCNLVMPLQYTSISRPEPFSQGSQSSSVPPLRSEMSAPAERQPLHSSLVLLPQAVKNVNLSSSISAVVTSMIL